MAIALTCDLLHKHIENYIDSHLHRLLLSTDKKYTGNTLNQSAKKFMPNSHFTLTFRENLRRKKWHMLLQRVYFKNKIEECLSERDRKRLFLERKKSLLL